MIIYKATNKENGKIYIGKTKNLKRRIQLHRRDSVSPKTRFHASIKLHGINGFIWEIITECNDYESDSLETKFITKYNSTNENVGYNLTSGGGGGDTWTLNTHKEETRKRLSESIGNSVKHKESHRSSEYIKRITEINRKKAANPIYRQKISDALKGRKFSDEHKLHISIASKGKILSDEHVKNITKATCLRMNDPINRQKISDSLKGRPSPMKGRNHSIESREKMSKSRLGRKHSEETKEKIRQWHLNKLSA